VQTERCVSSDAPARRAAPRRPSHLTGCMRKLRYHAAAMCSFFPLAPTAEGLSDSSSHVPGTTAIFQLHTFPWTRKEGKKSWTPIGTFMTCQLIHLRLIYNLSITSHIDIFLQTGRVISNIHEIATSFTHSSYKETSFRLSF
jgi:hypothetical protein